MKETEGSWGRSIALDDPGLSFFRNQGVYDLMYAFVIQSIQDLCALNKRQKDELGPEKLNSADSALAVSASWLDTKEGHACVSFLMPDVDANIAVAKIYSNPEAVLQSLSNTGRIKQDAEAGESDGFLTPGVDVDMLSDSVESSSMGYGDALSPSFA